MDKVEEIRLQEMYHLSQPERDRIQEEVHGVHSMAVEETASLLSQKYQQFDTCLQQMPNKPTAYEWALQHPDECHYVLHDRNFHVMFLRADLFDVTKAVQRYCRNIQVLFKYFGAKALRRPLRYTDLQKGEIEVLRTGMIQILPSRDRAGRLIAVVLGAGHHPKQQYIPAIVYLVNTAFCRDELTQRLGAVLIWSGNRTMVNNYGDAQTRQEIEEVYHANPFRYSAIHICLPRNDPLFRLIRLAVFLMVGQGRVRTVVHQEITDVQCLYSLMAFGIPVHNIPITITGNVKTKSMQNWLKAMQALDKNESDTKSEIIFHPQEQDVLFSRGGVMAHHHFGNCQLRGLIETKIVEYNSDALPKKQQRLQAIWREIVEIIVHHNHGRLLTVSSKSDGGAWWVEIQDAAEQLKRIKWLWYDTIKRMAGRTVQSFKSDTEQFLLSSSTSGANCIGNCSGSTGRPCIGGIGSSY